MEIAYRRAFEALDRNPCPRATVVPPNRLDTGNSEILAALWHARDTHILEVLRDALREMTGAKQVLFAPSARCAIAQVLSLLPQHEVVMPAYTCPVVKEGVSVAGKRIVYADIQRKNLNATSSEYADKARPGRVLLPTHLFGIPTDIENICELAKDRDCVTIEDAAAAFGARRRNRLLGTFADFGIFSFERSKRVPAFRGAVIIVNNDKLLDPAKLASHRVIATKHALPAREMLLSLFYNVATNPWLYGRLTLPQILQRYAQKAPSDHDDACEPSTHTAFYNRDLHPFQAALVLRVLRRMDRLRDHIARIVRTYQNAFRVTSIETFLTPECDEAALLRFPIAFPEKVRAEVLRLALRRALYLETNFERPLAEESDWASIPNSVWAAQNVVLLPLYRKLRLEHAESLAGRVAEIAREIS
jgi:dTDP-4-amino-4,6-dideoxygalactose transaminase